MAMSIGDANDVQVLVRWLYGLPGSAGQVPARRDVEGAAERLADRSHQILGAGSTAQQLLLLQVLR